MSARRRQTEFTRWLAEHQRIVFKVAATYAHRTHDRDDLEQEICTQAWRSFARYDHARAKFSTWLYRVALNVAISHVRRQTQVAATRTVPLEDTHLEHLDGGTPVHEPDARIECMHRLIGTLDPLHRALMLLYLEDRSHAEIAEILGISTSNVGTKLHRITRELRQRMQPHQDIGA
ncbi:RNA polymerase sigma factor [Oleiagrimonas soli]|uniref:RNA polymerase sigma 70 n=1 Tax=Oleiagrimonas soli TaxID=1543381 RepID=A0A099CVW1_9GAMM|nr:RNA polymerase sigma factor [Oleiagrimonas soli]KGI77772.1 RNA polymerase sigma 70 [Oleiagrimonas soli]MBB6183906.1 RNA polymerase sigma-70 factor (ECF subfamily) [Oleiagrimonas soli]